jgi:hypothetical protein
VNEGCRLIQMFQGRGVGQRVPKVTEALFGEITRRLPI